MGQYYVLGLRDREQWLRELENMIERELIHKRGKEKSGRLRFEHFEMPRRAEGPGMVGETGCNLLALDEAMSRHIRRALLASNGKISGPRGAAQLLGINPNTLRGRMRKLGISLKYS